MATPGGTRFDKQICIVDEVLRALLSECGDGQELDVAAALEQIASRASGTRMQALARAGQASDDPYADLSVADRVHARNRQTRRAARADTRLARDLDEQFRIIGAAWQTGQISEAQARAIVTGLGRLPAGLSEAQLERCQRELVDYASRFDPDELRQLAQRMIEVIDPEHADRLLADQVERDARLAFERRFLVLTPDHHGSLLIRGQLPIADGELLSAQLDALLPSAASYLHSDETPNKPARRADALVRLAKAAAASGTLPAGGGDRPQVLVNLDFETLRDGLRAAHLLGSGEPISARDARRLACDCSLIPAVLGADSVLLDQGRSRRIFTGALRTALIARDRGCAFPGCDAAADCCDGHHIVPWAVGGRTELGNGVLLCPYHHRLVEPDPLRSPERQWQITFDDVGLPVFIPPLQVDPRRRPRQHHRYQLRQVLLPALDEPPSNPLAEPSQSPNWT